MRPVSLLLASLGLLGAPDIALAYFPRDFDQRLDVIAFGSCNRDELPQPLWPVIAANNPDLWIWGGDNIYADWRDPAAADQPDQVDLEWIESRYQAQFQRPDYTDFRERFPILGTWDDHDFGRNNAGSDYPLKYETQNLALDFMEVPETDPRRKRDGIYGAYTFGPEGEQVKILLLDTRFFATAPDADDPELLGAVQRRWLADELTDSSAQIHLIVSGIQVLAEDHRWDKWANFPGERQWLLDTIAAQSVPGVIFLSGDRHIHEITAMEANVAGYTLVDATSSGLTHSWESFEDEPNHMRKGPVSSELGFGLLHINWERSPVEVRIEIRNRNDAAVNTYTVAFD